MQFQHLPKAVGYITHHRHQSQADAEFYCLKPVVTGNYRKPFPNPDARTWKYYAAKDIKSTCRAMADFLNRAAEHGTLVEITENPEITAQNPHVLLLTRVV